jgi:hypothetical protein
MQQPKAARQIKECSMARPSNTKKQTTQKQLKRSMLVCRPSDDRSGQVLTEGIEEAKSMIPKGYWHGR